MNFFDLCKKRGYIQACGLDRALKSLIAAPIDSRASVKAMQPIRQTRRI